LLRAARNWTLSLLAIAGLSCIGSARVCAQTCVRTTDDLEVPAVRVEADGRPITVGLEHAQLSIDAADARAEVSRPLALVGVASVAWRTSESLAIERAIFIPSVTAVHPGARDGVLRVSGAPREDSVWWSGVPVRCEALELGPPQAPPSDCRSQVGSRGRHENGVIELVHSAHIDALAG
jgi:hypothetical protein